MDKVKDNKKNMVKKEKIELTDKEKDIKIKSLLKEYGLIEGKKSISGKKIRKSLRKLGYYLSQHKVKKDK
jgi:hypothetical protein